MSPPKRVQTSAYTVYMTSYSSDKYGENGSQSRSSDTKKMRVSSDKKKRDDLYDSDEEVLKSNAPKSLMDTKDSYSDKQYSYKTSSSRKKDSHFGGDGKSTQSLMDIDFSGGHESSSANWKDYSGRHGHSSEEDETERRTDWKGDRKFSKYSDSEEEDKDNWQKDKSEKTKRSWKESSSHNEPLIVDVPDKINDTASKSSDAQHKPKPLLETYVQPPNKKPVSLLDLPNTGSRAGEGYNKRKQNQKNRPRRGEGKHSGSKTLIDEERQPSKKLKLDKSKGDTRDKVLIIDSTKISIIKHNGHIFVMVPSSLSLTYLHGRAKVTVLLGDVSILACKLQIGTTYDVYSPASCSLLSLNVNESKTLRLDDHKSELSKYGFPENELEKVGTNIIAVIMLDKLESTMCDYVTTFIPYSQLFIAGPCRDVEHMKGVTLSKLGLKIAPYKEMVSTCMNMSQDYEDVLSKWSERLSKSVNEELQPIVLCCGAKSTGKSTFNRMLINTTLQSTAAVAYLECDVGQTEFSPPATVSLHIITQPVLGPPFCHQLQAEKMVFYGETTPTQDPSMYLKCLKYVFNAYKEVQSKMPLIVNTMGFPEGIGLMLLIDTMHIVEPDLVVQLESFNQAANFPAITQELVALEEGWTYNKLPVKDPKQKVLETHAHDLLFLSTLVSQRRDFSFKLKPVDLRNLSLLSALSAGLERGMTLTSLPPYTVPYEKIGIHVCHHHLTGEAILSAVDASVVALCVTDLSQSRKERVDLPNTFDDMPVCTCLGFGIVRGVDPVKGLLYIVTTLPKVLFGQMNTLLKGSLSLPDQIILKQKSPAAVPYVDALAPSTAVTSVRPRSRMPRTSLGN